MTAITSYTNGEKKWSNAWYQQTPCLQSPHTQTVTRNEVKASLQMNYSKKMLAHAYLYRCLCPLYHWWELSLVSFLLQQTNMCLLWQNEVGTKVCLPRQNFWCHKIVCHDKIFTKVLPQQTRVCHNKSFVMTSILFSWQKTSFATAKCVCQTQLRLSWHIFLTTKLLSQTYASTCLSWQKWYLWRLPPMTLLHWLLEQAYWHVL